GREMVRLVHNGLYLEPGVYETLRERPAALTLLRSALKAVPGILDVYTRDDLLANRFDDDAMGRRLAHSFDESRSADLALLLKPYWTLKVAGAEHGSGYRYDTHVPVFLMGEGVVHGEYLQPAAPTDIAPTLAFLAGITLPRP